MAKIKNLLFLLLTLALLSMGAVSPPVLNAAENPPGLSAFAPPAPMLDTTVVEAVNTNGYSITFDYTKDSTGSTVTDWFALGPQLPHTVVFTHTFVDTSFGRSAGNDTLRCILQTKDAAGNVVNSDTIGTGSEGSEKLVSSGVAAQYSVTPKKYGPYGRLVWEHVVTGDHKNGRGIIKGSLFFIPK